MSYNMQLIPAGHQLALKCLLGYFLLFKLCSKVSNHNQINMHVLCSYLAKEIKLDAMRNPQMTEIVGP